MTPKEIAEMIINQTKFEQEDFMWLVHNSEVLAHAYLELEKKISEAPIYDIYVLESEIIKQKEENVCLKIDYQALENSNRRLNEANERIVEFESIKKSHIATIEKLKKSRDVLRRTCEFYGDKEKWSGYSHYQTEMMHEDDHEFTKEIHYISNCDCESNCRCEPIDSGKCNVYGGKKAREALKADDEIMKG